MMIITGGVAFRKQRNIVFIGNRMVILFIAYIYIYISLPHTRTYKYNYKYTCKNLHTYICAWTRFNTRTQRMDAHPCTWTHTCAWPRDYPREWPHRDKCGQIWTHACALANVTFW